MKGAHKRLVDGDGAASATPAAALSASTGRLAQQADAAAELESLRRTRVMLERQLAQMDDTMEAMATSDATLAALGAKVEGVDGAMAVNTSLVGRLRRLEATDDMLVSIGWAVFALVLAYVWADRLFGVSVSGFLQLFRV